VSAGNAVLEDKIAQAVNVSPVLDNCFFHALALYFLANQIPLPEGLFTRLDNDTPALVLLKNRFPNMESLDLFQNYALVAHPRKNYFPHHLVEKTMILGIFLRRFFINRLYEHRANCQALFQCEDEDEQGVDERKITFMSLMNGFHTAKLQDIANGNQNHMDSFLQQVEHNPIYQANSDYFINYFREPP